jgi:Flp pilus assembly pilin Flp
VDPRQQAARERSRALTGVVLASALAYPLLWCAVRSAFAQFATGDDGAAVVYGVLTVALCVAVVGVVRWSTGRRVRSVWLLVGLVPPALLELWLAWPLLTG